jgi:hypothetical protein
VSYTSHASTTPNIHTVNITTGASKQVSDVGDAIWVAQWSPVDSSILATTLPDVDTVRIVHIVVLPLNHSLYVAITQAGVVLARRYR